MAMLGMRRNGGEQKSEPQPEPISPYAPRPQPGPQEIGGVTVEALRQVFAMPAAKMREIANQLRVGVNEMADRWDAMAERLEHRGDIECAELAGLIDMTATCDNAGEALLRVIDDHATTPTQPAKPPTPVDLDAIAEKIAEVRDEASNA